MDIKIIRQRIIIIISIVLLIPVGILLYNRFNTFDFTPELYEVNEIVGIQEWAPFGDDDYKEVVIDDEVEDEILGLIMNRPYYKWNVEGYTSYSSYNGDIKILIITIKSSKDADSKLYYDYYISNTGQIEIRNRDKGGSSYYSLRKFPSSWLDIEGKEIKVLYNQLQKLIDR